MLLTKVEDEGHIVLKTFTRYGTDSQVPFGSPSLRRASVPLVLLVGLVVLETIYNASRLSH